LCRQAVVLPVSVGPNPGTRPTERALTSRAVSTPNDRNVIFLLSPMFGIYVSDLLSFEMLLHL
jgi:hypothetical protein